MTKKELAIELIQQIPNNEMNLILSFLNGYTGTDAPAEQDTLEKLIYHMGKTAHKYAKQSTYLN